ncbi:MAG: hypothetical protein RR365_12615 [Bacteroides sp.]
MWKIINIIILAFIIVTTSCGNKQHAECVQILKNAEKLIKENPDSALVILNLVCPDTLDNKLSAQWCMLSGKITDKIYNTPAPVDQLERANLWYLSNGSIKEQTQMQIYLGRSYASNGDFDKAMIIYTNALATAQKGNLDNSTIGYIYSYIGDLYGKKSISTIAISKYKTAAYHFKKENNRDSYICALRDAGREYTRIDSLSNALQILSIADSLAGSSDNKDIKASIENTIGNIYLLNEEYDKAKIFFYRALALGKNKLPNYIALIDLYIKSDSIRKAKELLQSMPQDDPKFKYSISNLYYEIYKKEKDYQNALSNLEESTYIVDSIVNAENQSKILDIETRYNQLKSNKEISDLKISQQKYIIISIVCILILLLSTLVYLTHRRKVKERIQKQQAELSQVKIELLNLSLDLEKKKNLLITLKENNEKYKKLKEEVNQLSASHKKLQSKLLSDSLVYKELVHLANQNIPRNNKSLITDECWKCITKEITTIYPNLQAYILNLSPNISEQEWQYCCFYMYGFDTNAEAKLLNINTNSVKTKHMRLRQKLNITLPSQSTLYDYLIENME